jgi:hypothetical protein
MTAELIMPVTKAAFSLLSSRSVLSTRFPPGVSGGGRVPIASLLRVATTTM